MKAQTLSHVALETVENWRTAAEQTVVAYRVGSHRLVGAVNGALEHSVYPRTAKLAPQATDRMNEVRANWSEVVGKGIDQVAERTEQAIEFGSAAAATQVQKAARFAAGIENPMFASSLETAARLTMPGAKVVQALSGKVAEGAKAMADAAGARPVRRSMRKAAAEVQRAAAPLRGKAEAAGRRAAKAAKAPVSKVRRAVARAAK